MQSVSFPAYYLLPRSLMRLCLVLLILLTFIKDYLQLCDSASILPDEVPPGDDQDSRAKFLEAYAKRMGSYMNTSVDPCVDFYAYACGNYPNVIEDNEIAKKQNALSDLSHVIDEVLEKILQKERQEDELYYEELQIVKQFLKICDGAQLWPLTPTEEYLEVLRSIGGFPAVDRNWNASSFDWFNMTAHLIRYGVVGLLNEEIFLKHPFPPYYEIPRFGFGFDVYSDNIRTNESLGYSHNVKIMKELLEVYGVNGNERDEVITEIIEFWKEAIEYQDKTPDRISCRRVSLEEELEDYEFPKWNLVFEIAWNANQSLFNGCDCPCDWYFKKLDEISANKSKAMANYMALKFLFKMHGQLRSIKHHHQYCMTQVKSSMPIILTFFYMKEHFSAEERKEVEEIIQEIKASFMKLIESSDWLDDESRKGIQMTLNTLVARVGEVTDPISDSYIRQTKQLNLTGNYAADNLALSKLLVDMHHYAFLQSDLNESTAPLEVLNAIQVNAFYNLIRHRVNVLAGILFPPVYHKYLPNSVKYASLGYIVGHEIVHSLEYRGPVYEKSYKNYSTWTDDSILMAVNRTACFIDHHSNYVVPVIETRINRTKNTKESIADSGGLREAFDAYRNVYTAAANDKVPMETTLPGLNLTSDETFFLSFAQVYCAKYEPKHYWSEIYEDHPMDRYRVISSLQNFEEFSATYNCSLGSPMNPEKKCRLW